MAVLHKRDYLDLKVFKENQFILVNLYKFYLHCSKTTSSHLKKNMQFFKNLFSPISILSDIKHAILI